MKSHGLPLFLLLFALAAVLLACGSSQRALKSVGISPASAEAQAVGGEVQFSATGYYSAPPSPVTPAPAYWGACYHGDGTAAVTVNSSGLARCTGTPGTYEVWASVPNPAFHGACPQVIGPCSGPCGTLGGSAQLTCQ